METIYPTIFFFGMIIIFILAISCMILRKMLKKARLQIIMQNLNIKMLMNEPSSFVLYIFKKIPVERWGEYRYSFGDYVRSTITDMCSLQDLIATINDMCGLSPNSYQREEMYELARGKEKLNFPPDLLGKIYFDCLMGKENGSGRVEEVKYFINQTLNYFPLLRGLVRAHIMNEFRNFAASEASSEDKTIAESARIKFGRNKEWKIEEKDEEKE